MCIGKNSSSESLNSDTSRRRSPKPERKNNNSAQSLKNANKPQSQTRAGLKPNVIPGLLPYSIPGFKQNNPATKQNHPGIKQNHPVTKQNHPATKQNNPATKQNNPATKQNNPLAKQNIIAHVRKTSNVDVKQIISKVKVPGLDVLKEKVPKPEIPKEPPKKLKNRGVLTQELYPAVVSEKNKQTYVDAAKVWKTPPPEAAPEPQPKDLPGPSTEENRRRRSLKLAVRRQLWNWSKHALNKNEHWSKLFKENAIDIDKINIDKVDLSLINMDGLGIENKFVRRTVEWLLK